jgi:polyhydroxyalkanoate synthesis regulator phasin
MTEPRGNGPLPPDDDLATLAGLDLALDELAAGRSSSAEAGGEVAALAAVAAELREAVPPPPPGAAERGRAAILARSANGQARGGPWRRSRPLRLLAVAAALVVLVGLPATARQARPGTALWPVREVGQQVRERLADDPVHRARLRLSTAADYVAAGAGKDEETRKDMADAAEEKIEDALEGLKDLSGPQVAALRSRAIQLEAQVEALERQEDADDRSGSGGGTELGDDRTGPGGGDSGDDPAGDDNSGSGGGSSSGKGSGSGSGSGSNRSGSGDD